MSPRPQAREAIGFSAIVLMVIVLVVGCSLDYGAAMAEDLADDMPDTVVIGFVHTVVDDSYPRFRLEAERAESYQGKRLMRLSAVKFTEFAPGSTDISSEGRADMAVLHTDTESAAFSGLVSIRSIHDGITLESGYLEWDGQARRLKSRAETVTSIVDDDGTSLAGSGFSADAATRSFSFQNRADGTFVAPDPDPETQE
ncbi:MAG: LPS export ABC transporter periplasmic protein LptC [Spirochaetia bacterium]|nr:LPS export ABC transporter periplasmic protein LptC [Spirochaetia bacterium]